MTIPDKRTIICSHCDGLADWNSYFQRYICSSCHNVVEYKIPISKAERWDRLKQLVDNKCLVENQIRGLRTYFWGELKKTMEKLDEETM